MVWGPAGELNLEGEDRSEFGPAETLFTCDMLTPKSNSSLFVSGTWKRKDEG